jgi:hypothetical protein
MKDRWRSRCSRRKNFRRQTSRNSRLCIQRTKDRIISMFLRRLAAVSALCGVLATSSVADTSLCRIMCSSRAQLGGSSATHHDHHSPEATADSLEHRHMSHHRDVRQSMMPNAFLALNSAPCTQYRPLVAFLNGSRTSLSEASSSGVLLANPAVTPVAPTHAGAPSLSDSPSPPESSAPRLCAPTLLRI